jgi:RNA polymerase nonessential primary-like sigma factor
MEYRETGSVVARNRVVETHLRLVAKICRRHSRSGSSFDDLMAEGSFALIRAVDSFDPGRGVSFTSYATAVVEHAVRGATRRDTAVKMPSRERRRVAQRYYAETQYFASHGRLPSAPELRAQSGDSTPSAPSTRFVHLGGVHGAEVSLDASPSVENTFARVLADRRPLPPDLAEVGDTLDSLRSAIDRLPTASAEALRLRFGVGAGPRPAPRRTGKRSGVSERVVQAQVDAALRQLRESVRDRAEPS